MNVWRLVPFHDDNHKDAVMAHVGKSGRIALAWGKIGDLRESNPESEEAVVELVKSVYPTEKPAVYGRSGSSIWALFSRVQEDDLIIITGRDEKCVAQVTGPYEWDENGLDFTGGEYFHKRVVEVTEYNPEKTLERAKLTPGPKDDRYKSLIHIGTITTTTGLSF